MQEHISPAIALATKQLNLTQWGQIQLTVFTEGAINHGLQECKKFPAANDPFKYFLAKAKAYSTQNNIKINWKKAFDLQREYKITGDEPTVYKMETVESVVNKPEATPTVQWYQHKEVTLDFDEECRKWHEMVINWDNIEDPKKKCHKDWKLSYPGYMEWLKKLPFDELMKDNIPEVILYAQPQDAQDIGSLLRSI